MSLQYIDITGYPLTMDQFNEADIICQHINDGSFIKLIKKIKNGKRVSRNQKKLLRRYNKCLLAINELPDSVIDKDAKCKLKQYSSQISKALKK